MLARLAAALVAAAVLFGGSLSAKTLCDVRRIDVPFHNAAGFGPEPATGITDMAEAPDGSLWAVEGDVARLVHVDPSGTVNEIPMSTTGAPTAIAVGTNGSIYFTEYDENMGSPTEGDQLPIVGERTKDGEMREHRLALHVKARPQIVAGPHGDVWFTADSNLARLASNGGVWIKHMTPEIGGIYFVDSADNSWLQRADEPNWTHVSVADASGNVVSELTAPLHVLRMSAADDGFVLSGYRGKQFVFCGAARHAGAIVPSWCFPRSTPDFDGPLATDGDEAVVRGTGRNRLALVSADGERELFESAGAIWRFVLAQRRRVWLEYDDGDGNPNHLLTGVICDEPRNQ